MATPKLDSRKDDTVGDNTKKDLARHPWRDDRLDAIKSD